ncbi:MAG: transcriptional regulator TrmB [Micromonosporaceae bacterium]|nr:transcriptional regulator TrmB [Micromonosporaceae bacterium]
MHQPAALDEPNGHRPLATVGVDQLAERIYRHLLDQPTSTLSEVATDLALPVSRVRRAITGLENMGLVSAAPTRPRCYTAASPQVALEALVHHQLEQLSAVRAAAEQLQERFHATVGARAFEAVELLTGPEAIGQHFTQMEQTAQREIAVLDRPPYFLPAVLNQRVEAHALRRGIPVRGVYAHQALELPGRLEQIRTSARVGEQARLIAELPLKVALVDDSALVPLLAHPGDERALVIHRSALVAGLYLLFELLWEQATPLSLVDEPAGAAAGRAGDAPDCEIATLLASGLPDKVIARQLGVSLRTVARRVGALMDRLGAQTRFQAGVRAATQGLLDPPPVA